MIGSHIKRCPELIAFNEEMKTLSEVWEIWSGNGWSEGQIIDWFGNRLNLKNFDEPVVEFSPEQLAAAQIDYMPKSLKEAA